MPELNRIAVTLFLPFIGDEVTVFYDILLYEWNKAKNEQRLLYGALPIVLSFRFPGLSRT
jgi:hypothetical protein